MNGDGVKEKYADLTDEKLHEDRNFKHTFQVRPVRCTSQAQGIAEMQQLVTEGSDRLPT